MPSNHEFPTTHWSVVLAAGNGPAAHEALETLCKTYWLPVYAYIHRRASNIEDAQDLTQEFIAQLLDGRLLRSADPSRGRFRALLLTSVRNYLINQNERATALKRGAGHKTFPLDFHTAQSRVGLEPKDNETPERIFDRQWAIALLDAVLARLQNEFQSSGKAADFTAMKPFLTGTAEQLDQAALAHQLGMTVVAARAALYRFRKRYRQLLRDEIAQTVSTPAEVEEELNDLFRAFE